MTDRRRGLGRGLGALIPPAPPGGAGGRPVDVFFPEGEEDAGGARAAEAAADTVDVREPREAVAARTGDRYAHLEGGGLGDAVGVRDLRGGSSAPERPPAADRGADRDRGAVSTSSADEDGRSRLEAAWRRSQELVSAPVPVVPPPPRTRWSWDDDPAAQPEEALEGPGGTEPSDRTDRTISSATGTATSTDGVTHDSTDGSEGTSSAGAPAAPAVPAAPSPARPAATAPEAPAPEGRELVPVPGAHFAEVPVDAIAPNPRQPRQVFDDDSMSELVHSVREIGVLQPVVLRPLGPGPDGAERYELVMGERRWRACQQAGLPTVPAIVRSTGDDAMLRDALLENLHRSDLNPLEEAAAYQQLLDDFGCTHDQLAQRIGRSRPQISNTIRLLRLPPLVQRRVAVGVLSAGHARALLGLPDGASMERLAQRVVAEGLSVRATEEVVALGGDGEVPVRRRGPRRAATPPQLQAVATRLSDRFETRVSIAMGQRKGRLTVEFATVDDLDRILEVLAPGDPGIPHPAQPTSSASSATTGWEGEAVR